MALDGHDDIVSLQYISNDSKMFLKGGAAKGAWWHIGKMQGIQKVFVAEGFATAATIYEQTGIPCAIAFSAGNIHATVKSLRELVGITCSITICADLDESGIGLKCANEAATQSSANVILSPAKSDFNDAFQSGIDIIPILCPAIKADFLLPLSEFCKKPSPIKWLVKKWIQSEGLCMVHGPSGCGKTFVVIDWMCRIASNMTDWSGSQVSDGTVVYLAGEGHQGLKGRFEAWSRNFYGGNTGGIDIFISKEGCDLNTPNGYILARESILSTQKQPVCIVIDTLHRFMVGDENSAQDAGTMIKCCALLQKEFNCTVLLVHHTGVNEETQHRARGSSAWKGALETEISVKQNKAKQIEIISRKTKDSEPPESKFFELRSIILDGWDDEDGEKYTSAVLIQDEYGEQMASKNQNSEFEKAKNEFNLMYFDLNVEKQAGFGVSEAAWKKWGVDKLEKSETAAIKYKQRIKKILIEQSFIHELNGFYYLTNDE
jgi:hypothetical protein